MKSRNWAIVGIALLTAISLCACGAKNASTAADTGGVSLKSNQYMGNYDSAESGGETAGFSEAASGDTAPNGTFVAALEQRKVIKRASFSMQAKDFQAAMNSLEEKITTSGSYIENSESWGEIEQGNKNVSMTVRVPVDQYEAFKAYLPEIGNVTSSSESGEDVTSQYFDTDARLTALRTQEKRLLELLEQAQNMEDLLAIEDKLTNVRLEIEQLTTTLKRYDGLISYATVTVNMEQTRDYVVKDDSFGSQLWQTVKDSAKGLLEVGKNALFVLIWALPYLILIAVIALIVRWRLKKRRAKKAQPAPNGTPPVQAEPETGAEGQETK